MLTLQSTDFVAENSKTGKVLWDPFVKNLKYALGPTKQKL